MPLARVLKPLLAALVLGAFTGGCSTHPSLRPAAGTTFRVMTYNIHHGAGADDRLDLERIAEVIRRERPDIVALQEVDRGVARSERRDLLQELAVLTGLEHTAFGKNIDHQGGDYGNGLLSRYPIVREVNTHLDQVEPGERRGVLQTIVDIGGREVAVLVTHFDVRNAEERLLSARQVEEQILPAYRAYPLLFAGDFNDVPHGAVYQRLTTRLADAWTAGDGPGYTIPVHAPARRIDFVFHTPHLKPVAAHVPRSDASDHLPVVVDLQLAN